MGESADGGLFQICRGGHDFGGKVGNRLGIMICGEDSSKTHFNRMAPTPCPHPELYKNPRLLPPPSTAAPAQAEWREYVAGWGSGIVNICVTFPVNKTMFRQQLHGISALSAFKQLRSEGLLNLYRGILPPLLQKSASTALMFGSYEQYRRLLLDQGINSNTSLVTAAFLAGCTEALLTPFERIQTLMLDQKYSGQFRNTPHAFQSVYSSLGVREYYRGRTACQKAWTVLDFWLILYPVLAWEPSFQRYS